MQRVLTSINIFRATFLKIRPAEEGLEFKLHRIHELTDGCVYVYEVFLFYRALQKGALFLKRQHSELLLVSATDLSET